VSGFLGGKTLDREPASWAGGVAGFNDILGAAYDQMRLVDNSNAAAAALEDAYATRSREIKEATGIDLGNPVYEQATNIGETEVQRLARGEVGADPMAPGNRIPRSREEYARKLLELEKQFPDKADVIKAGMPVEADAKALARQADERLAELMASNPSWDSYAASFIGGAGAGFRDPLVLSTLVVGGGPGAARTIGGRIVTVALKEALLNGATAAAAQPFVQDWRRQAGLDNGFDQAAQNVLFSAGFGGAFGAAGAGIGELVSGLGRRAQVLDQVAKLAAERPELADVARRALSGDTSAATTMLRDIRDVLPADVRGAIDALDELEAREGQRQAEIAHLTAQRHEELASRAERAEQMRQLPDLVIEDTPRVNRLVRELAPSPGSITDRTGILGEKPDFAASVADLRSGARAGEAGRRPVTALLKRLGGVDPSSPIADELRAIGITSRNSPGLFDRSGRRALDNVPVDELPQELRPFAGADDGNGYVREQAFVDGLAAELEGRPWRQADEGAQGLDDYRRYLEDNGVDFERMSDEEIRAQLEAIDDAERRFLAAEPNELGLSTDEVSFLPPGVTRRAYTGDVVRQVLQRTGAGVSDDVVKAAADAVIIAGETIDDAVDFALSQAAGTRKTLPPSQFAELPSEPPVPAKDAPVDPPADADAIDWKALEDEGFTGAMIPFGDDLLSLEALKADLDETAWLERVVDACKL
jgi:hypothetical protein